MVIELVFSGLNKKTTGFCKNNKSHVSNVKQFEAYQIITRNYFVILQRKLITHKHFLYSVTKKNTIETIPAGELVIQLEAIHPSDIFGLREERLKLLRKLFPKIKIIVRGSEIKAIGDDDELSFFEKKFHQILDHFEKLGKVTDEAILEIIASGEAKTISDVIESETSGVLLHGRNGMIIKARSPNQQRMVDSSAKHDMIFAIGPAGTGKTYTAVALAVRALKNKEVRRIILTRPAVEAGENLGFLPGDLKDKLDPYLQPLYDALRDMIPPARLETYLEDKTIEIAPLAFMRGRTLDNAFAILDEAQNATESQLKMFLTRMGKSAKFIITGDITQIDLPRNQTSGLIIATRILNKVRGIDFVFLNEKDVIRHPLVTKIIKAYEGDNS
jgi:phosphate starvation-inducible PhoH-like protein